jgi:hypothetical protein
MVVRLALGSKEKGRSVAMAETTPFTIGAEAVCTDGVCGAVTRVVIDPVARALTHLVVEPAGRQGLGRLVPLDLVEAATGKIRLLCTIAEFEQLDSAEETQFVPGTMGYAGLRPGAGAVVALCQPGRRRERAGRPSRGGVGDRHL